MYEIENVSSLKPFRCKNNDRKKYKQNKNIVFFCDFIDEDV